MKSTRVSITLLTFLLAFFWAAPNKANGIYEFQPIPIGKLQIYPLHDADTSMEARLLPELDNYPEFRGLFKNGPAPAVSQTYYLRTGPHNVLIDAGWGNDLKIKGQTQKILEANGIRPESITDILLTHLDMDHIGGLQHDGKRVFPNATLWISEPEAEAWQNGRVEKRSDAAKRLAKSLWDSYPGSIRLFKYGEEVLPGITAVDAAGHTPGHTAFDITSGNDKLTIAGDIIHISQIQLPKPDLSTLYDMDMEKAAVTRKKILEKANREKAMLGGMHFPMISDVLRRPDGGFMMREAR